MEIKIKKLNPDAKVPFYATDGAAGFDLVAVEDVEIHAGCKAIVKTGLAIELPHGFELQIRPRSGLSAKTHLMVSNSPGTVDEDYRGEIMVLLTNVQQPLGSFVHSPTKISKGDRIAQGVVAPVYRATFLEVNELSSTERGTGGFGSTGK